MGVRASSARGERLRRRRRRGSPNWKSPCRARARLHARARRNPSPHPTRRVPVLRPWRRVQSGSSGLREHSLFPAQKPECAATNSRADRFANEAIEREHEHSVDSGSGQKPQTFVHRRKQSRRLRGPQKLLGVRIEGDGHSTSTCASCFGRSPMRGFRDAPDEPRQSCPQPPRKGRNQQGFPRASETQKCPPRCASRMDRRSYIHGHAQPVMSQTCVFRQGAVGLFMAQIVRNVREPCLTRADALRPFERLLQSGVAGVGFVAQSRQREHFDILQAAQNSLPESRLRRSGMPRCQSETPRSAARRATAGCGRIPRHVPGCARPAAQAAPARASDKWRSAKTCSRRFV